MGTCLYDTKDFFLFIFLSMKPLSRIGRDRTCIKESIKHFDWYNDLINEERRDQPEADR